MPGDLFPGPSWLSNDDPKSHKMGSGTASTPGSSHDLDDRALGRYLAKSGKIPNLQLPVVTTKIGYGQSNPTYYVDDAA